jgi:hypothetical protein
MRPLTLHASALSDAEYDAYTANFRDLVDDDDSLATETRSDAYYEQATLGVREVRAWLRGRYPQLAVGDLDAVRGRHFCEDRLSLTNSHFVVDFEVVLSCAGQVGYARRRSVLRRFETAAACHRRS